MIGRASTIISSTHILSRQPRWRISKFRGRIGYSTGRDHRIPSGRMQSRCERYSAGISRKQEDSALCTSRRRLPLISRRGL